MYVGRDKHSERMTSKHFISHKWLDPVTAVIVVRTVRYEMAIFPIHELDAITTKGDEAWKLDLY